MKCIRDERKRKKLLKNIKRERRKPAARKWKEQRRRKKNGVRMRRIKMNERWKSERKKQEMVKVNKQGHTKRMRKGKDGKTDARKGKK